MDSVTSSEMKILLNTVDKVKSFVDKATKMTSSVYIKCGRYIVDGKSILGIFSLNLLKPMMMVVEPADDEYIQKTFSEFAIEE